MSKGRNELKKHVRAAKQWLGAAEKSLDRQEDVKGDLSVMLAKAELQHASETADEPLALVWGRKAIPLLLAAVLAYGVVTFFSEKEKTVEQPVPYIVETHKEYKKIKVTEPVTEMRQEIKKDTGENIIEPVKDVSVGENVQEEKSTIPAEEMQKLMCTAGQNLRSQ